MAASSGRLPTAKVPDKRTDHSIWDKQKEYYTVNNLNSSSTLVETHSGSSKTSKSAKKNADVKEGNTTIISLFFQY